MLSSQLGSIILTKNTKWLNSLLLPPLVMTMTIRSNTNIKTINEANAPLILSSVRDNGDSDNNEAWDNYVITPECEEKFHYIGQTDINCIITVASFPRKMVTGRCQALCVLAWPLESFGWKWRSYHPQTKQHRRTNPNLFALVHVWNFLQYAQKERSTLGCSTSLFPFLATQHLCQW